MLAAEKKGGDKSELLQSVGCKCSTELVCCIVCMMCSDPYRKKGWHLGSMPSLLLECTRPIHSIIKWCVYAVDPYTVDSYQPQKVPINKRSGPRGGHGVYVLL